MPDELTDESFELVRRIAYHLVRRSPAVAQVEDLIQVGMIGLIEASRSYDATQGASFRTYAGIRIQGAILDELRRLDVLSRRSRRKSNQLFAAECLLEQKLQRPPTACELATDTGLTIEECDELNRNFYERNAVTLDATIVSQVADSMRSPDEELEEQEFQSWLAQQLARLPDRQRFIVRLYYHDGLTLAEIALMYGISQARVSQILIDATTRLRNQYRAKF